jgi:predicted O-linked N-acetylglucosamine transferase (SPINDLY family)/predicted SAM-dependent methyltransferase
MSQSTPSTAAPKEFIRLHIGGSEVKPGWTLMNRHAKPGVDVVGDGSDLSMFANHSVAEIYAPFVYQRFGFRRELPNALLEAFRVLIPGGVLRLCVPNLENIAKLFSEAKLETQHCYQLTTLLYGEQLDENDFNRSAWAFEPLAQMLDLMGFRKIESLAPFDLFNDVSSLKLGNVSVSLNMICEKETNAIALNNRGGQLLAQGMAKEAIDQYQMALVLAPEKPFIQSNYLYALNYQTTPDMGKIFAAHKKFGEFYENVAAKSTALQSPITSNAATSTAISAATNEQRPLRIGYVSSDFRHHAVSHFIEPVLAAHDKNKFQLFAYYHHTVVDDMTKRIQSHVSHWRSLVGKSDVDIAAMIRADGIDILIDLAGHTATNRLPMFARKPAPLQVTWLGYPNTTGLSTMDYRITDAFADPSGMTDAFHTEKLHRMPETFSCYSAPTDAPAVAPLQAKRTGRVTFGSFNNFAKITAEVITVWSNILKRIPTATLFLKYKDLESVPMTQYIHYQFMTRGVLVSQLRIQGDDASHVEHMARYNNIDIALDPFPYNGTTTTLDALWMGVPVITLEGASHVGRVGVSQMSNLGLQELIAKNQDDYVNIAVELAGNIEKLSALRAGMRERMLASPLMNVERFTRNLEQGYEQMWAARLHK